MMTLGCRDCAILVTTLSVLGLLLATPFLISPIDVVWQYFHLTFALWAFAAWFQVTLLITAYQWIKEHPDGKPQETKPTLRASLLIFVTASIMVIFTLLIIIVDHNRPGVIPFGAGLLVLTAALIAAHARFSCRYYRSV